MTAATPGARDDRALAWWVALGCLALTVALYLPSTWFTFVSDDVAFVHRDPHWLRTALLPAGTWHYYPLTQVLFYVLAAACDWHPEAMHVLNFLLHSGIGLGLFLLLRQFGLDRRAAVIAPLFFISRGISYEVVMWITELSYLCVVTYTLVILSWWDRYLRGQGDRYLHRAVVLFAIALLTIEHALLVIPLLLLYDLVVRPEKSLWFDLPLPGGTWRGIGRLFGDALRYLPFALVTVAFLAIKFAHHRALLMTGVTSHASAGAPFLSGMDLTINLPADRTWHRIFNTPMRAYLDLLMSTFYLFLPVSGSRGAEDNWLTRVPWLVLLPWLAVQAAVLWKGRPLTRFWLLAVYVYTLPLAIASVPAARYYYLSAVPAAALVGIAVAAAWNRLGRLIDSRVLGAVVALLMVALIVQEGRFIRARMDEWKQASDMVRASQIAIQRDAGPGVTEVYLLDFPRWVPSPYWGALAFANAAEFTNSMLRPPRMDLAVRPVYDRSFVGARWPTIGTYMTLEQIREKTREPKAIAYQFVDRPPWVVRLR